MKVAEIAVARHNLETLSYRVPEQLQIKSGDVVVVPLRNAQIPGIVLSINNKTPKYKLKDILHFTGHTVCNNYINFLTKAARYYCTSLGTAIKAALPLCAKDMMGNNELTSFSNETAQESFTLSHQQMQILENILNKLDKDCAKPILLHGVTGSGKTLIYVKLAQKILQQGKQVLILVPEIALTTQMLTLCTSIFLNQLLTWHSNTSAKNKRNILQKLISGKACIVIGARSALFLPYSNLGLIVVDEEHDQSYKQNNLFLYNARDMAVLRGKICNTSVILGSATPALETYFNCIQKKYHYVHIASRFRAQLPKITLIDTSMTKLGLCTHLIEIMRKELNNNNQVMLFLNRRGYASVVVCAQCRTEQECKFCSNWLTWYKQTNQLKCKYCNYTITLPIKCLSCNSTDNQAIIGYGQGVEKVKETIDDLFPHNPSVIMSMDTMNNIEETKTTLEKIQNGEYHIVIGTQVISKGYNFPNLSMVVVIDADLAMKGGDVRALERTFQMLHQVSGRAGRLQKQGQAYIQTRFPHSEVMQLIQKNDFKGFINHEIQQRKMAGMPPFSRIAKILLSAKNENKVSQISQRFALLAHKMPQVKILGPVEAEITKIKNIFRQKILLIADKNFDLQQYIKSWLQNCNIPPSIKIKIDIDPYDFD
ncbi:replication restart helicase PriA [Candidatus Sneabacter namystus]|uniref:Replication restart protein PriA n=1 Tax=Candidatus Sneabacter namystus TaxID=2601646 RepID=A0A5C0UJ56_9RICK|nr:primosomal protein N' [Candidatus Sneabacter namystus]QEK39829.1 primosomal protein N' [Candidatus Sneabacter namystus]